MLGQSTGSRRGPRFGPRSRPGRRATDAPPPRERYARRAGSVRMARSPASSRPDRSLTRQLPANMPSTRIVPMLAPFPGGSGMLRPGGMIRERSSWPSRTLSYSGRKRGGAGVSASGRGASGRSNSSRPRSSRKVSSRGRSRSTTSRRRVRPDHAWMSITDAGPKAPQIADDQLVHRRMLGQRPTEPGLHRRPRHRSAAAPQPARRDVDERHEVADRVGERIGRDVGPAFAEQTGELRARARSDLDELATGRQDLG